MGKDGKYAYGSGRARQTHWRDRAQLEFDDMLIDDFIDQVSGEVVDTDQGRSEIPVRFGTQQLAEFLDDSAIASALIRGELPEMDSDIPPLTVGGLGDQGLFDLVAEASVSPPAKRLTVATQRATAVPPESETPFTLGGVIRGFVLGAASAAVLLLMAWALL